MTLTSRKREMARKLIAGALCALGLAAWLLSGGSEAFALTNTADITVSGSPRVFAIDTSLYLDPEPVNNSGQLRATATAADPDQAEAYGMYATGTATNTGNITANAVGTGLFGTGCAFAYGIVSDGTLTNSGKITSNATASQAVAYGLFNTAGGVVNSGEITVIADGADIMSMATGIISNNAIVNTGKITVMATGGSSFARGLDAPEAVTNSGEITATATGDTTTVDGIFTDAATSNSGRITATSTATNDAQVNGITSNSGGNITNSGSLTISATGDSALASGLYFIAGGDAHNTGNITVTANSSAFDAEAYPINRADNITNSGNISATAVSTGANAAAFGITLGSVTNSGRIDVSATAGPASNANAYGISSNGTVVNSGPIGTVASGFNAIAVGINTISFASSTADIRATATGLGDGSIAVAYGINSNTMTNSGNIDSTANGGEAYARGITSTGPITNTGALTVGATGASSASAYGIDAYGGGTVTNSGTITVSASGPASKAYGIFMGDTGTLTNTGIIQAPGENAYEVFVNTGTTTLAGRYAISLDGTPARGSIYVNDTATVDINNALLSINRADLPFNTEYRVFAGPGTVAGMFSGIVQPRNPSVSYLYHDKGTPGSTDDTVSVSYHPGSSSVLKGTNIGRQIVNAFIDPVRQSQAETFLGGLLSEGRPAQLAQAGSTVSDAPGNLPKRSPEGGIFLIPYTAKLNNSSGTLGYDTRIMGFEAGADRLFGRHQLGFHAGFGTADTSFGGSEFPANTRERQHVVNFGLQDLSRWGNWIVRGDATGFFSHHVYSGVTGLNFEARESAAYESYGTTENILAGYAVKRGAHVFLPEIGLNHTWIRQDAFSSTATAGGWPTDYSSVDNHRLQGLASLRWLSRFSLLDFECTPSASVGGRHRLTNDSLTIQQTVAGSSPVTVASEQDRTAATATLSLALAKGSLSSEVAYSGEYSGETTLHGIWLKFIYAF